VETKTRSYFFPLCRASACILPRLRFAPCLLVPPSSARQRISRLPPSRSNPMRCHPCHPVPPSLPNQSRRLPSTPSSSPHLAAIRRAPPVAVPSVALHALPFAVRRLLLCIVRVAAIHASVDRPSPCSPEEYLGPLSGFW
jgi:hypothetical protein